MSEHDGFLVKEHRPYIKWVLVAIAILFALMAFYAGRYDQHYGLDQSYEEIQRLNVVIEQLSQRNEELVMKNADLLGSSKVERDAYVSANQSIVELQKEILLLKEELVFYRGIVSPDAADYAVNLQEFSLQKTENKDEYSYKLVLTKQGKSSYSIRGDVIISLVGLLDGKEVDFDLNDLVIGKKSKLKYSFKYFQIFENRFALPEGFFPEVLKVRVKSRTKKVKSLEQRYNWAELLSGEE